MKRLFVALLILEAAMLIVLALPVLHKRPSYDHAAETWKQERTDETLAAFQREQARRDRQVMIALGAMAGLCVNALAICFVFDRLAGDQPPPRRGRPALSARRRRMKRLAQFTFFAAAATVVGGSLTFARALRAPAVSGLHSLVVVLVGGMLAFVALVAWMLAATGDQAVPIEPEAPQAGQGDTDASET